jgi:hypothetical protein
MSGLVNLEELQISRSKVNDSGIASLKGEHLQLPFSWGSTGKYISEPVSYGCLILSTLTPKRLKVPLRPVEYSVYFLYLEWIHTFNRFEFNKEVEI